MPILSSWLDLPQSPSNGEARFGSAPSVFSPPVQDRRQEIRGNIFSDKNQKKIDVLTRFQAYQSMMRREQEARQADDHAAAAVESLKTLNPRDQAFPDAVAKVIGDYPLAANHKGVQSLLEAQHSVYSAQRDDEQRKLRQEQEVMQALETRPDLAALYDNEARISGDIGAKRRVYQQMFNDKLHASLVEANPDITDAELDRMRNPATGMFDPVRVEHAIAQSKRGLLTNKEADKNAAAIYKVKADMAKAFVTPGSPEAKIYEDRIAELRGVGAPKGKEGSAEAERKRRLIEKYQAD